MSCRVVSMVGPSHHQLHDSPLTPTHHIHHHSAIFQRARETLENYRRIKQEVERARLEASSSASGSGFSASRLSSTGDASGGGPGGGV